jgi:hypothetical protein
MVPVLPVFSKVAVVAAVLLALVAAPVPAAAAVTAYRVDFWVYLMVTSIMDTHEANVTASVKSDLASVFGTGESAITIQDYIILPDTNANLSFVFTIEGGNDAPFLASPLRAQAPWTTKFNNFLYRFYMTQGERKAAATEDFDFSYYYSAYINNVQRLGTQDVLPKRRYLELTLHGKHLANASANLGWADALRADLSDAFGISEHASTHLTLMESISSGVNNSTLSMRFSVKPLLNAAVNRTTFFATNGTAPWLWRTQQLHTEAAAADLGIPYFPVARGGAALDTVPESESALTVTGAAYAPGDEAYTNAPGDAAPAVTTAAVFIAAAALFSVVSLF